MKKIILVSILFLVFTVVVDLRAEVYQYTDKDGVVVITDKDPGSEAKKVTKFKTSETAAGKSVEQGLRKDNKPARSEASPGKSIADQEALNAAEAQKRRNEEASRLEAEAGKSAPFSSQKQIEQREQLEKARKLRSGTDQP